MRFKVQFFVSLLITSSAFGGPHDEYVAAVRKNREQQQISIPTNKDSEVAKMKELNRRDALDIIGSWGYDTSAMIIDDDVQIFQGGDGSRYRIYYASNNNIVCRAERRRVPQNRRPARTKVSCIQK